MSQNLVSCISSGHYIQVLSHLDTIIHKQSADLKPTPKCCLCRHLARSQSDKLLCRLCPPCCCEQEHGASCQEQNSREHVIFLCTMICQHYHSSKHVLLIWINTQRTKNGSWAWLEVVWQRKPVLMFWFRPTCWLCCDGRSYGYALICGNKAIKSSIM